MFSIENIKRIAEIEFADIVKTTFQLDYKLMITEIIMQL